MRRLRFLLGGASMLVGTTLSVAQQRPAGPQDAPRRVNPARLLEQFDRNKDGLLDRTEVPEPMKARFEGMDLNKDGKLSREELEQAPGRGPQGPGANVPAGIALRLLDTNGDGKLSREELQNAVKLLDTLDRNKNGFLDAEELVMTGRPGGRPGEVITPAARGERIADKLKVGDVAPTFNLPVVAGKGHVRLADLTARKPTVLIFASYT